MTPSEHTDRVRHVPALSAGERRLLARFTQLGEGWDIFERPHLDGDRPSVAILHPNNGAMVWDVRDWNVAAMSRDGRNLRTGDDRSVQDPIDRLRAIRQALYHSYIPDWAEALNHDTRLFELVRLGLYLPSASRSSDLVEAWSQDPDVVVICGEEVATAPVRLIVPRVDRPVSIKPTWHAGLQAVFAAYHPPAFGAVPLSREQANLVTREHRPGRWGIEGVAGSGKSLVLARRATALAASPDPHKVLLVTYNITLANFCRAMIQDSPDRFASQDVTVQHFHGLAAAYLRAVCMPPPVMPPASDADSTGIDDDEDITRQAHYDQTWPAYLMAALEREGHPEDFKFDSILVDEGQDFSPAFLDAIEAFGVPEAEITIAYDRAQRLYARKDGLERIDKRRISGLDRSWRMSTRLADIATQLGQALEVGSPPILVDDEALLLFGDTTAQWVGVDSPGAALVAVRDLLLGWRAQPDHRPHDVAVLVNSREQGAALVELLAASDIETNHVLPVFSAAQRPTRGQRRERIRRFKVSFTPNDQRTKVSTIHSYKGWDAERVIIVQPRLELGAKSGAATYVAVTRPRSSLTIVSDRHSPLRRLFDPLEIVVDAGAVQVAEECLRVAHEQHRRSPTRSLPISRAQEPID